MSEARKEVKRRVHHTSRFTRWMFGCDKEGKPDRQLPRLESVAEVILASCAVLGAIAMAVFAVLGWSGVIVPNVREGFLGSWKAFTTGVGLALIIGMIVLSYIVRTMLYWWLLRRLERLTVHHPETLATRGITRTMSALAWEVYYAKGESEAAQAKARFWEAHELAQVLGHGPDNIRGYLKWSYPPNWLEILKAQAGS